MSHPNPEPPAHRAHRVGSDAPFLVGLLILGGAYVFLIGALMAADAAFIFLERTPQGLRLTLTPLYQALGSPEIRYAMKLSLISCSLTAMLSLWVAVPIGYLMSRFPFRGKTVVDALLDVPIVLPPLVIGLSLLILFQTPPGLWLEAGINALLGIVWRGVHFVLPFTAERVTFGFTYTIPSVILAQFMVACAFAVRTMRAAFDEISPRQEEVALTLGCTRSQAFWNVVLPEARRGALTAGTLAWARALGEFGPILIFAGATRMHTEVLPSSVFLEMSVGNVEAAVAVSLIMILAAVAVLVVVRVFGHASLIAREDAA